MGAFARQDDQLAGAVAGGAVAGGAVAARWAVRRGRAKRAKVPTSGWSRRDRRLIRGALAVTPPRSDADGCSVGTEPAGPSVGHADDVPAALMGEGVVGRPACERQVVEVSGAAVPPVDDVVRVALLRRRGAAGEAAAAVAERERGALGCGDDASVPPVVEHAAAERVTQHGGDGAVAQQAVGRSGIEVVAVE